MVADPLKYTIDAQSGRFEFFKHTLTFSAAGLAGMAALFTDPAKIPIDVFSKATLIWCGFFFAATLLACLLGISTYSNLLLATPYKSQVAEAEVAEPEGDSRRRESLRSEELTFDIFKFAARIVHYARITLVTLLLSGLGLLLFASKAIFREPGQGEEAVLEAA
jgi:hypothetical protein